MLFAGMISTAALSTSGDSPFLRQNVFTVFFEMPSASKPGKPAKAPDWTTISDAGRVMMFGSPTVTVQVARIVLSLNAVAVIVVVPTLTP